jgi:hypothetical protein
MSSLNQRSSDAVTRIARATLSVVLTNSSSDLPWGYHMPLYEQKRVVGSGSVTMVYRHPRERINDGIHAVVAEKCMGPSIHEQSNTPGSGSIRCHGTE